MIKHIFHFVTFLFLGTTTILAQTQERPNVVIIYGDDVGYGDVGAYGSTMIPTPNIDKLAKEGIRFTDGHCSAATCTPSRYSLLTGVYAFRNNINVLPPDAPLTISTDAYSLPKLFKEAGYTTGVIGKWHLGLGSKNVKTDWNGNVKPGPLEIGFDSSFLLPSTNDRVPCVFLDNYTVLGLDRKDPLFVNRKLEPVQNQKNTQYPDGIKNPEAMTYYLNSGSGHNNSVINGIGRIGYMSGGKSALWNDETISDVFIEKTKAYIKEHKNEPFFLYYAAQDIHVPRAPHPRFRGSTELGYRGDAMVQFDWATGEIMKALEENGLTENTIVIFSSDNGPTYDDGYDDGTTIDRSFGENDRGHDASGIYRGGKYQIYEGGTRVPFIVRWPERIKPGVSDAMVNQIDFIASFSELLDQKIPDNQAMDSQNTLNAFLGINPKGATYMLEENRTQKAIRKGDWKYIIGAFKKTKDTGPELYNLKTDPGEQNNIIALHMDIAKEMDAQLRSIINKTEGK
ncbi:sulfatase family protein [Zobellia laminariae]|uniref:sulfatase family protein n=1 Tax=Zobellia laminariae TaxID=248906 RepID=UPI004057396A